MEIIPILHTYWTIFMCTYGFIIKKNVLDYYYLFYTYLVVLSWTLLNGDCIITYYYNKQKDQSYEAGNFTESSDLHSIFGEKYVPFLKKHHQLIVSTISLFYIASLYKVFRRHQFSPFSIFILLSVYIIYYLSILYKLNLHALFFVLLLGCLLYILKSWK